MCSNWRMHCYQQYLYTWQQNRHTHAFRSNVPSLDGKYTQLLYVSQSHNVLGSTLNIRSNWAAVQLRLSCKQNSRPQWVSVTVPSVARKRGKYLITEELILHTAKHIGNNTITFQKSIFGQSDCVLRCVKLRTNQIAIKITCPNVVAIGQLI